MSTHGMGKGKFFIPEPTSQDIYDRVAETGFASIEDMERFSATTRIRKWCDRCGRVAFHRDHLSDLGLADSDEDLACLGCLARDLR